MGELSFIMSNRVNGVAALHTGLMKTTVFEELNRLHPGRIVNETNGVTPRRWVHSCNPRLSSADHRHHRRGLGRRSGAAGRSLSRISRTPTGWRVSRRSRPTTRPICRTGSPANTG
jgi:glucan phosphorylase